MKKFLLFPLLFIVFSLSNAQEPIVFEKVFKVDSVEKDVVFSKLKEHFTLKFKSSKFFKVEDRQTGLLISTVRFEFQKKGFAYTCYNGNIDFIMNIQVRDGRYKVVLSEFKHIPNGLCDLGYIKTGELTTGTMNGKKFDIPVWVDLQKRTNEIAEIMLNSFDDINFKEDNW